MVKTRGVDLEKNKKKTSGEFLYLSFAEKTTLKLHKMAYLALGNPPGSIPNVSKSKCHQNLSNTVFRIKIDKIKR